MHLNEILHVHRTWTNWSIFEPDPDHSPDAGTRKSEIESWLNRHVTQSRLQVAGCTAERNCLLHVIVQGQGSFRGHSTFLYNIRLQSYGASKFPNFRILAYFLCRRYMRSTECPSSCYIFFLFQSLPYLLVSWVWWDWPMTWLTNHCTSMLWNCWLGHLIRKVVHKMTEWNIKPYYYIYLISMLKARWLQLLLLAEKMHTLIQKH